MEEKYVSDFLVELGEKLNSSKKDESLGFNIFKVLGVQNKEVILCRFLGELLNPQGSHACGSVFLNKFIKNVLNDDITDDIDNANVKLEDATDENRRVDIVIYTGSKKYPIEVKIWAGDQEKQLSDYYINFFKESKDDVIFYITPDGHEPSKYSKGKLESNQIKCISFNKIKEWLKQSKEEINNDIVKQICGQMESTLINIEEEYSMSDKVIDCIFKNDNDEDSYAKAKAACVIITESKNIEDKIRNDFINKYIENFNKADEYTIVNISDSKDCPNTYCKKTIKKGKEIIAYLCVDTNFYLQLSEKYKLRNKHNHKWVDNWIYIDWIGSKNGHIDLRHPKDDVLSYLYNHNQKEPQNILDFLKDIIKKENT